MILPRHLYYVMAKVNALLSSCRFLISTLRTLLTDIQLLKFVNDVIAIYQFYLYTYLDIVTSYNVLLFELYCVISTYAWRNEIKKNIENA